jgi:uncharacterized membrane protein
MATVEQSIEANVPVRVAYDQWTQFEDFPHFLEGVESVTQLDDTHLRWVAEIGGQQEEWTAEIVQQIPDDRIEWRSTSGVTQNGAVTFEPIGADRTRINVRFEYEPEGVVETLGSKLGQDERRVKGDLERFKEFIESRGVESGAWRGTVEAGPQR